MTKQKLSASAMSLFLKSPKAYYWRYIARLAPAQLSVTTYDHDKIWGTHWAGFIDRFYKEVGEEENSKQTMTAWLSDTDGWVPDKARDAKTKALETLMPQYYQMFSPKDGCRTAEKSELWIETDKFVARLDGLSDDNVVHEVKSTSRSPNLTDQLWKVQNSIQVKLYCVLTEARGHCVEFGFKDSPYQIFRGPVVEVSEQQRKCWDKEINALADRILSLGEDPCNYPCNSDSCCMTTKYMSSMCSYQPLCDMGYNEMTKIFYKKRD